MLMSLEVSCPVECRTCKKFLLEFNISCPYLEKEVLCPEAQAIIIARTNSTMRIVLEQLNIIKKE